jgi:hypothetical protein
MCFLVAKEKMKMFPIQDKGKFINISERAEEL